MGFNRAILQGNLGADPEMRYTANGNAVTNFRLAVGEYRGSGDDRKEHTEWFTVVAWNKLAEVCGQHLAKGRAVLVEGRIVNRQWEDNGVKHYKTEIVANSVTFLGKSGGPGGRAEPDYDAAEADDLPFT